jgi:protein-tyrosine-phosphatase
VLDPLGRVATWQRNPVAVAALAEVDIDIAGNEPTVLTTEAVQASDVVITMGCGDECPYFQASGTKTGSSTTRPAMDPGRRPETQTRTGLRVLTRGHLGARY